MMNTEQMMKWIDQANYEQLLQKWRFAPTGDPMLQGEVGEHYGKVMARKRDANPAGAVAASKRIGW